MGNTILLADKSATIQKIVELTFDDANFNIISVNDGQSAMDLIPQVRPNLILADISLPVKNGYEICSAVRTDPRFSTFSQTPVILLAGIYDTMDEDRARQVEERVRQVQANDFLSKPFDPQLLISKVKQYISVGGAAQEPPSAPIFAEEQPDSAINLFDSETAVQPVDDAEKTMMLPGGPFGSMFASEPVPLEEEAPTQSTRPVNVESVTPANEPVFGDDNFPEMESGVEEEDSNNVGQSTLRIDQEASEDGRFGGREEQEFEYNSGPVLQIPVSGEETEARPNPLILENADDPFGDVFQESATVQWNPASTSEEDSPFGSPETPLIARSAEEEAIPFELPSEPAATEQSQEPLVPSVKETFEDTWPGMPVRSNMAHPVEDLFESEPPPVSFSDESEELQADLSDSGERVSEGTDSTPKAFSGEISEELIDRIAERVLNKLSERVVSEIVWQVVPDLAERMIRRELEKLHAGEE